MEVTNLDEGLGSELTREAVIMRGLVRELVVRGVTGEADLTALCGCE
jgi:hypothetical protein